jgi:putative OPT family oligopeptide transporter
MGGLFQKPASTPEAIERSQPLALPPDEVAKLDEDAWYARVYRGDDVPQLTVRAVAMGAVLGFLLAFTNVYVSLKAAWTLNVALTACIVSFTVWTVLLKMRLARSPMSILENNCMQSTASAAGYSTGGVVGASVPALLLLSVSPATPHGRQMPWLTLAAWVFLMALLGVAMAIPMKRSMINHDRLKFPSGIAAAETLHSLYSRGAEAVSKGRALIGAALVATLSPLLMDLKLRHGEPLLPSTSRALDWLPGPGVDPKTGAHFLPSDWTAVLDHKLVLVGVGVIAGPRVSVSLMLGAVLLAFVVGPAGLAAGAVTAPSQAWLELGLWVAAPMLLASGLLSLAFSWRALRRSGRVPASSTEVRRRTEVPPVVFLVGTLVAGTGLVIIAHKVFETPVVLGVLAVVLTFALSLAACRATGESDITPLGPMAVLTQLLYGILMPRSAAANLMAAGVTTSGAASSADLLTDWKSGYLLGASPRRQFVAQMLGIVPGTVATVLCYYLLVPDATAITGSGGAPPAFPAPAAQMWLAVAHVVTRGLASLHPMARWAMLGGAAVGVLLVLLERLPPRWHRFIPSPIGLGMGFAYPFQYPFSMFIGGVIGWLWYRRNREHADRYAVPIASGAIAGESLVGVLAAVLNNFVIKR